jgi:hypothetical protein
VRVLSAIFRSGWQSYCVVYIDLKVFVLAILADGRVDEIPYGVYGIGFPEADGSRAGGIRECIVEGDASGEAFGGCGPRRFPEHFGVGNFMDHCDIHFNVPSIEDLFGVLCGDTLLRASPGRGRIYLRCLMMWRPFHVGRPLKLLVGHSRPLAILILSQETPNCAIGVT